MNFPFQILNSNTIYKTLIFSAMCFAGCADAPDYPKEPVIEFVGISKDWLLQNDNSFADSLIININFTDGDGDLGNETPNDQNANVFVIDGRDNFLKSKYQLPYIDEQGAGNGVSGNLNIRLNTSCCIYSNGYPPCSVFQGQPTDTLFYKIYIVDRAGNKSNEVQTPPITLICQ